MTISELISKGREIEKGLTYVQPGSGIFRTYDVYRLANQDEYYNWKEVTIRFLQLYYQTDVERFVNYSKEFETKHFIPRYISNMVGVLEACEAIPSEKFIKMNALKSCDREIESVLELERLYVGQTEKELIHKSGESFHEWHAAACVLFDKWFYPTDEDWVKFQDINGDGNGYTLKHEFDRVYSSYRILIARLKDGRGLKGSRLSNGGGTTRDLKPNPSTKISIFISYAHSDKKWLEKLKLHLKVLSKYYEPIEYWEDTKLRGGDKWREEITKSINKANVAILLVSTAFLASDFISSDELPPILKKAQEDGTTILPIIVSPCDFEDSELGEFQAINNPERTLADLIQDEAAIERVYLEVNKRIKELL
jgi:hypothetical protein